jgi:hypothetical protein
MNLKSSYKYQFKDNIKAIMTFYLIIFAVILLVVASVVTVDVTGESTFGGIDVSTAIFLFVAGLCSFKEPFLMLAQNGVSRKTVFTSRMIAFFTTALMMAAADKIILLAGKAMTSFWGNIEFNSFYEMIYPTGNALITHMNIFIFDFIMYMTFITLGYLITILFYRLGKLGKTAVGAGIPITFVVIIPLIDAFLLQGKISAAVERILDFMFGISSGNPFAAMISFTVLSAIFGILSWLLMRKAAVKV